MTPETLRKAQRNEYKRKWMKDHPGKAQEYRRNTLRRRALADLRALTDGQKRTGAVIYGQET